MARGLSYVYAGLAKDCEKIRLSIRTGLNLTSIEKREQNAILKFSVISLLDAWGKFSKLLVAESSVGNIETASGRMLPRGSNVSLADALRKSRVKRDGTVGDEPRWHDASIAIAKARRFAVGNYTEIQNAIGDANSPADQIRLLRNFCAHENNLSCFEKLQSASWASKASNGDVRSLLTDVGHDGRMRFDFWIDELELIGFAACQ